MAETIDLDDAGEEGEWFYFSNPETPKGQRTCPTLDPHGLPYIGQRIEPGEPLYCCVSDITGRVDVHKHKKTELCIVDEIRLLGSAPGSSSSYGARTQQLSITLCSPLKHSDGQASCAAFR